MFFFVLTDEQLAQIPAAEMTGYTDTVCPDTRQETGRILIIISGTGRKKRRKKKEKRKKKKEGEEKSPIAYMICSSSFAEF